MVKAKFFDPKWKTITITGGTGSFGKTLIESLLQNDVEEIRVLSRDEVKQEELRNRFSDPRIRLILGDVRDRESVRSSLEINKKVSDAVFHAAALKQVPNSEFFPNEAIATNVMGTLNLIQTCNYLDVKKVVFLSTDKAVYPINTMGMTKALMEKICVANSYRRRLESEPQAYCVTRYGNVLASRGSVIPTFVKQYRKYGEIYITNPSMTRFLMSLEQAIKLVYFAMENGQNGDIFVQKSPAATLEDLAVAVITILGGSSKHIKIGNTRHGEKLHETLIASEEFSRTEDLENYYRICPDSRPMDYDLYFKNQESKQENIQKTYSSENTEQLDVTQIIKLLCDVGLNEKIIKGSFE